MAVVLAASNELIVAAQISLSYDPAMLDLVDVRPGASCDATSPFTYELGQQLDAANGQLFYAVGEDPLAPPQGTLGPATLICLEFAVLRRSASNVCLNEGVNPATTLLVNSDGYGVPIDNIGHCLSPLPPPTLACKQIQASGSCTCMGVSTDCSLLDNDCNLGVCNEETAACERLEVNENGPCDDGDDCSVDDTCLSGVCIGSGCTNPSLCIVADVDCGQTARRTARILLGDTDRVIVGAQFTISFDPGSLDWIDVRPGSHCDPASPFDQQLAKIVDEEQGQVFYSVGLDPFGEHPDISGGATLACVEFDLIGISSPSVCLSAEENPFLTLLAGYQGSIPIYNAIDCPTDAPPPAISCDDFCVPIPAASQWGLVILALLLLTGGKCFFGGRRAKDPPTGAPRLG